MSEAQRAGFVVKLLYEDADIGPRWVTAGASRGFGSHENATVFPDRRSAESEAKLWQALSPPAFSFVVEPV
jgi:hypothetical protein